MDGRLLIVEDDRALGRMLTMHFEDLGFAVELAESCGAALARLERGGLDLVVLDQQLPDGLGVDLIEQARALPSAPALIMMTGVHDLELAIEAVSRGAAEFVHKPVRIEQLQQQVVRLLEHRLEAARVRARPAPDPAQLARELIGRSDAMLAVSKEIALSAATSTSVLVSGESGTGKEVVARLIHRYGNRDGPFVAVNCAAIVDTLLESELFGHERGAFTGAVTRKAGKFELADRGTLFLDEIGELAAPLQAKLLRALQERRFERVGGSETLHSGARVVVATNRDLAAEVAAGRFREDLLYRLNPLEIRLPPLRERREDIALLAEGLLARVAERVGRQGLRLGRDALARLEVHDWPGNVRELENVLTQAAVHAREGAITADLLDGLEPGTNDAPAPVVATSPLRSLAAVEAEHVQRVLDHTGGHKARSCEILGISRPALDRKILKYDLRLPGRSASLSSGPGREPDSS
ncbi:Fis family transcriptional regulator [Marichromatium purpuratum 984]|uniref:Fis family transcriptional regulator n=1 Tax=Marichromatium purpuratum 984 TaxID=765910 RepID=W0E0E6_MARPU|nr:sigma-54 dependent transcriptional regulator [Marichromatium purpuratum]AHF03008.1 Fis family transcriptional regulator [Marichromatium purpuratum 984]